MGFWENITGTTINGRSTDEMPEQVILACSIRDHVQRLINIRREPGSLPNSSGIEDIPEVLTEIPPWIQVFARSFREMVLEQDHRITAMYLYNWHIEKREACLSGKMTAVLYDRQMVRLQMFFPGIGNNRVLFATAGNGE